MRLHDEFPELAIGPYGDGDRDLATWQHLTEARFELETRANVARGRVELTFARGESHALVPGVLVDLALLAAGNPAAVRFPRATAPLFDESSYAAVVDALIPHLQLLVRARTVPLEARIRIP